MTDCVNDDVTMTDAKLDFSGQLDLLRFDCLRRCRHDHGRLTPVDDKLFDAAAVLGDDRADRVVATLRARRHRRHSRRRRQKHRGRVPGVGGFRVEPASEKLDAREPRKNNLSHEALKYFDLAP